MHTRLTQEQVEQYREQGFVTHRQLLDPDEVSQLKTAVLDTVASMGSRKIADERSDWTEGTGYYDRVFTQKLNLWRASETVKQYMLHPEIGRMLCDLEGVDGYRVWHDQALIKEPFGNPTGWHLDNPYWSFYSRHAVSIWIALEDATLENGCMWFMPGSHKLATWDNVGLDGNQDDLFRKAYPAMAEIDPVPAPMRAGDCSFHNGLTAHGANANMTRQRRVAMTCAYMPVGATFNGQQNVLPQSYFDGLSEGEELNNDDWNPLVTAQA